MGQTPKSNRALTALVWAMLLICLLTSAGIKAGAQTTRITLPLGTPFTWSPGTFTQTQSRLFRDILDRQPANGYTDYNLDTQRSTLTPATFFGTEATSYPGSGVQSNVFSSAGAVGYTSSAPAPVGPYFADQITVASISSPLTSYSGVDIGFSGGGHQVLARYKFGSNQIAWYIDGSETGTVGEAYAANQTIGLTVDGPFAHIWVIDGAGTRVVGNIDLSALGINCSSATFLSSVHFYYQVLADQAGTINVRDFCTGYRGGIGSGDITIVRNKDGSPYVRNGSIYIGMDNYGGGPGSTPSEGYETMLLEFWAYNLTTKAITKQSKWFIKNGDSVLSDKNVCLLRDDDARGWQMWTSNGYQFLPDTGADPLTGIHIRNQSSLTPNTIPAGTPSNITGIYDITVAYNKANGYWYAACSATLNDGHAPYQDALFRGLTPATVFANYVAMIPSTDASAHEGPKIASVGGILRVYAATSYNFVDVYDLTMTKLGTLSTPAIYTHVSGGANEVPHADVAVLPNLDGTSYARLFTFDEYYDGDYARGYTYGHLLEFDTPATQAGWEGVVVFPGSAPRAKGSRAAYKGGH